VLEDAPHNKPPALVAALSAWAAGSILAAAHNPRRAAAMWAGSQ
jgi:hypothetical protein